MREYAHTSESSNYMKARFPTSIPLSALFTTIALCSLLRFTTTAANTYSTTADTNTNYFNPIFDCVDTPANHQTCTRYFYPLAEPLLSNPLTITALSTGTCYSSFLYS